MAWAHGDRRTPRILLLGLAVIGTCIGAAEPEKTKPATPSPVVVRFGPDGMPLEEVVRVTLQHDPTIQLQAEDVEVRRGVTQEASGQFDLTLFGQVSYEYREQELTESRKEIEQKKRDVLDELIRDRAQDMQDASVLQTKIGNALAAPPGTHVDLPDPELNAELLVLDTLIAQTAPGQAQDQLIDTRNYFLNTALTQTNTALLEAIGGYDEARTTRANIGNTPSDEVLQSGLVQFQAPKQYRSGIVFTPFADATFNGDNFKGKRKEEEFGGKGIEDQYVVRAGVEVLFPLMRGRGKEANTAIEKATAIDVDAGSALLRQEWAVAVRDSALAYWDLRAAQEFVEIAAKSASNQAELVALTEGRVRGGDMSEIDLARARASKARSDARLEDARSRMIQSQVELARRMGIAVAEDPDTLPKAIDDFPTIPESVPGRDELEAIAKEAPEHRDDVAASRLSIDSGQVLVRGAELETKSRLDARASVWTTALGEASLSDTVDRWVFPSYRVGLEYEKIFGNNLREGRLVQRQAELAQQQIGTADLTRRARLGVVGSGRSLPEVAQRARSAEAAVASYEKTLEGEKARLRAGDASLIDTILTEDQQTSARADLVAARLEYARLLTTLRYEAGQLVTQRDGKGVVAKSDLVTLPSPTGVKPQ